MPILPSRDRVVSRIKDTFHVQSVLNGLVWEPIVLVQRAEGGEVTADVLGLEAS